MRVQRHIIESAVTEAWLEPLRAVRVRHRDGVTHEIHNGRMVAKAAK
jgi:hypothetical protein